MWDACHFDFLSWDTRSVLRSQTLTCKPTPAVYAPPGGGRGRLGTRQRETTAWDCTGFKLMVFYSNDPAQQTICGNIIMQWAVNLWKESAICSQRLLLHCELFLNSCEVQNYATRSILAATARGLAVKTPYATYRYKHRPQTDVKYPTPTSHLVNRN